MNKSDYRHRYTLPRFDTASTKSKEHRLQWDSFLEVSLTRGQPLWKDHLM